MITLVVPIYNMAQYLPRCVDSLLRQTCRDFEIVLVDDGSTDASGAMCDRYAADHPGHIRVIHKENGGLSSARNAGIDAARGEFVIFPDPDDWIEPNYVEAFLHHQRLYRADLVCLGHYVDTDDASVPAGSGKETSLLEGADGQRSLLLGPRMQGFSWNKLYRLDIIRRFGLRFPDGMGTTEDLYRRGKNSHVHAVPKSCTPAEYAKATGVEALFGGLYLAGQTDRINEIFVTVMEELYGL